MGIGGAVMRLLELGPLGLASHTDWSDGLPLMTTTRVMLRELRRSDAPALLRLAQTPEIAKHTWSGPSSVEAFEKFIEASREKRAAGKYTCFGVVPRGQTAPAGLFELRSLQPGFYRAEIAFFLDASLWGTGAFVDSAQLVCDFAFTAVGVHRIEARAEVDNDRANGALKKLGATMEGRLRASFVRDGRDVDQYLWSIVKADHRLPGTRR
jgi:[ribosomal protein S5]-alanine N-acetyltransferase